MQQNLLMVWVTNMATTIRGSDNFDTAKPISQVDSWRLEADWTANNSYITSNWEQVDELLSGTIGAGLTENSGTFSFPETGVYMINYTATMSPDSNGDFMLMYLYTTVDNSTYGTFSHVAGGDTGTRPNQASMTSILNITDTTNQKFKFYASSLDAGSFINGSSSNTRTGFTVVRLGGSV